MSTKKALTKALDTVNPIVEPGTMLKITIPMDDEEGTRGYVYAAVYVANRWYLTGKDRLLNHEYASTVGLFTALASWPNSTVEIVTEFETIRQGATQ